MDAIKPPAALKLTGNLDANWRTFKQQFELYLAAIDVEESAQKRKVALLLTLAGTEAIEVYNTFTFTGREDKNKLDVVLKKFDDHCLAKKNETYERYIFRSRMQRDGETFDVFLTDLKLKARTCNFGALKDSLIRDQIVFGVRDKKVREKLLSEADLKLENAVQICQARELTKQHAEKFDGEDKELAIAQQPAQMHGDVDVVSKGQWRGNDRFRDVRGKGKIQRSGDREDRTRDREFTCTRCGGQHKPRQCPAFGKTCSKCHGLNHYARMCMSKEKGRNVHVVNEDSEPSDEEFVYMVRDGAKETQSGSGEQKGLAVNAVQPDKWVAPLLVNGAVVVFRLDTGAKANLISVKDLKALTEKPKIQTRTVPLKTYNGQPIETKGVCRLTIQGKGKAQHLMFVVVPEDHESLLGDRACEDLGLVKRVFQLNSEIEPNMNTAKDIARQFPGMFKGQGTLPFTYKIQLKSDAKPVIHAPRRVPAPLRDSLKKELDRMVGLGVIQPIEEPTDWVNSITCVKKPNGELRVCLDPKDLNENIKREHYQIPTREEIMSEMAGAKFFSKLDASHGFWQLKLDPESSKYCTFNTPFGRYCFLRLPFGIKSAPEIFHRAMETIIEGLEGTRVFIDDIIVWGATLQQHNDRLLTLLKRIQSSGLKLNENKCQFGAREITFLGDKLSGEGVEPDHNKVQAILAMPAPTDKKGVLRAMGMVNFLGKFIPNLSAKTVAIRELLQKDRGFEWTDRHDKEWEALKQTLTKEPVLTFFDPSRKIKLSTDASKDGLGAVLLQADDAGHWRPVAYASRSMTETEMRYAQIEKETLGLVFGCDKFHGYIYGLPTFTCETDHQPLISIYKKNLNDMSPRIQRMMMRLQRYDMDLVYTPGKYIVLADALSRAPVPPQAVTPDRKTETKSSQEVERHINLVVSSLPVSDRVLKKIAKETEQDETLQAVAEKLKKGWKKGTLPQFCSIRAELSMSNGLLLRQNRIVIPASMREDMLNRIHEGHLGIEKCRARARDAVYWPGINRDIETMASKCEACLKHRYKQAKEPMLIPEMPTEPWQKVGTDLFHVNGKDFLLVIDYHSNYPEAVQLSSTSASAVITRMKSIFSRHGIPLVVHSDNGPQYSSQEFQRFAEEYGFHHTTSSPLYPKANGKAEKGVEIVKRLLKKAAETKSDPYLALLTYRSSPLACGASPAELLMNRKLRNTLPQMPRKKNTVPKQKHMQLKWAQKKHHDKTARRLEPLSEHDVVRIEEPHSWSRKAVVLKEVGPRSYAVKTEDGQVLRRNRRCLLRTKETFENFPNTHQFGEQQTPTPETDAPVCRRSSRSKRSRVLMDL